MQMDTHGQYGREIGQMNLMQKANVTQKMNTNALDA